MFECITVDQPVHSPADGCLDLFWLLDIENRAAMSICACVSVGICAFVSLDSVSKNGMARLYDMDVFSLRVALLI